MPGGSGGVQNAANDGNVEPHGPIETIGVAAVPAGVVSQHIAAPKKPTAGNGSPAAAVYDNNTVLENVGVNNGPTVKLEDGKDQSDSDSSISESPIPENWLRFRYYTCPHPRLCSVLM